MVDTICQDRWQVAHTSHNGNGHTPSAPSKDCPNCTSQHPASRASCLAHDSIVPNATKWDTGDQNAVVASHSNQGTHLHLGHSRGSPDAHLETTTTAKGRSNKTDTIDVDEDHSPQDEIALHYIQPNTTVRHTHLKEIMVGDVHAPYAMRHTPSYSCLQVPAEKGPPHSTSRSIPELEATCYSSVCFNAFIQIRSAQLAYPLALIMSVPDSLPTWIPYTPIWCTLWAPHLAARPPWFLTPQGKLILVHCRHPWSHHPGSTLK